MRSFTPLSQLPQLEEATIQRGGPAGLLGQALAACSHGQCRPVRLLTVKQTMLVHHCSSSWYTMLLVPSPGPAEQTMPGRSMPHGVMGHYYSQYSLPYYTVHSSRLAANCWPLAHVPDRAGWPGSDAVKMVLVPGYGDRLTASRSITYC